MARHRTRDEPLSKLMMEEVNDSQVRDGAPMYWRWRRIREQPENAYIDDLVQYYCIANAAEILQCSTDTSIIFVNICRECCGYRG